ncbi:hypothetical protein [Nocardia terpenica]|uniref:Uncharacterized protein n=1 Tax=Nocardia terpenica TaxID=455432 RepID=A0A6G9Z4S6_9NOCA|nr:hypothetical protein [Nocardia terpenica]QIS20605.1 hypothetical protein F6W96_22210 [Nocardia terpenica]
MQDLINAVNVYGTAVLWVGLCVQFVLRRGQPHREVLFATAGLAVAITMILPPVVPLIPRIFGTTGPCNEFQNIWGVLSSGLILLVIAAGRGRAAITAAAGATVIVLLVEIWLAEVTTPSPVGCVTVAQVPATSPFWWLMISWHQVSHVAALAVCLRDAKALRDDSWARNGVWWYTAGFVSSTIFWTISIGVLVTERRWVPGAELRTAAVAGSVVSFNLAVWSSVAQRAIMYGRDAAEFWSLYRELPGQGWSAEERRSLWRDSLRGWPWAPHRAVYRVRIAQADRQLDLRAEGKREGGL